MNTFCDTVRTAGRRTPSLSEVVPMQDRAVRLMPIVHSPACSRVCTVPVFEFLRVDHSDSGAAFCHALRQNTLDVVRSSRGAVFVVSKKRSFTRKCRSALLISCGRRKSRSILRDLRDVFCAWLGPIRDHQIAPIYSQK